MGQKVIHVFPALTCAHRHPLPGVEVWELTLTRMQHKIAGRSVSPLSVRTGRPEACWGAFFGDIGRVFWLSRRCDSVHLSSTSIMWRPAPRPGREHIWPWRTPLSPSPF